MPIASRRLVAALPRDVRTRARTVLILAQKELSDAARNRWVALYAMGFSVLALGLAWLGVRSFLGTGIAGFGRTGASIVHLVLLLVPLVGLTLGAIGVAGERERGTLLFLLAQPLAAGEVLLAKLLGVSAALLAALSLGFGASGAVIAWSTGGGGVGAWLALLGLSALLGAATVSMGLLVSTLSRTTGAALGVAVFLWLGLVFVGDLGVMGSAVVLRLEPGALLALALANPLQVFKVAAVFVLRGGAEILGPAGLLAARVLGVWLVPVLAVILAAWIVVPAAVAGAILHRRGAL